MRRTRTNYIACYLITVIAQVLFSKMLREPDAILFIAIVFTGIQIYFTTGRLKDMNANPWWSIAVILPFVGFILMFPRGTVGPNQYGEDPREKAKNASQKNEVTMEITKE